MTTFWNAWNWNPLIGGMLAFSAWRYMDGVWRLWGRAGTGRGVRRWQVACFWGGIIVLFIALLSPIDTFSETALSIHMIQHLLLTLIAPPLLVLGLPPLALIGSIPMRWRRGVGRWWHHQLILKQLWQRLSDPLIGWGVFALALWLWHLPPLYQSAVNNSVIHMIEHASFFGAGVLFWWSIHNRYAIGLLSLFTTAVHSSILGALMTFSSQVWYPIYGSLEDQQLAGLIMWVPGGIIFLTAVMLHLWRWLDEMEKTNAKNSI
jgi:putative membrane protein